MQKEKKNQIVKYFVFFFINLCRSTLSKFNQPDLA